MFLFDLRTKIEIPFQTLIILSSKFVEKERIWKKRVYPNLNVKLSVESSSLSPENGRKSAI